MFSDKQISVLVVDDQAIVREGMALLIGSREDIRVVGTASDGLEAIHEFRRVRPDVTLMDFDMPTLDGIEATIRIRQEYPTANVVILSGYAQEELVFRALQAGARGYLLKRFSVETLVETVRAVHAGLMHIPPEMAARVARRSMNNGLSERQLRVLQLIMDGKSNAEIATALGIVEGTVKGHVLRIMQKLGAADRTQAVMIALRRGILQLEP